MTRYKLQLSMDGKHFSDLLRDRYLDSDGNVQYITYTKADAERELKLLNDMRDEINSRPQKYFELRDGVPDKKRPIPMYRIPYHFRMIEVDKEKKEESVLEWRRGG